MQRVFGRDFLPRFVMANIEKNKRICKSSKCSLFTLEGAEYSNNGKQIAATNEEDIVKTFYLGTLFSKC